MITDTNNTDYINSSDYTKLETRLTQMKSIIDDLVDKQSASRKLRFAEIDIEVEREQGRIQPDELYIPVHTINTNIQREQSSYIQYLTQSPRAVILRDKLDQSLDLADLERDLSDKLRYEDWQLPMFANVDGFQANGYGIMELVMDDKTNELRHEQVQLGDFGYVTDTRDIQACELLCRTYYFPKTKLVTLCGDPLKPNPDSDWDSAQVEKVIGQESQASQAEPAESTDSKDKSLFKVHKVMFRINGIVHVGWTSIGVCDNWARKPRPLYIGQRELIKENIMQQGIRSLTGAPPPSQAQFETQYPYFLFQYLISEDDAISHLKGRVFLDQDVQEAVSSILSSTCTQARRASGFYASKDVDDPNDDILIQKNVYFKPGCLINKKVSFNSLAAPDPSIFSAIQVLVSGNQQETSQVNFAATNRKDSRKTAAEIKESAQQQQILSTVQVVLFSTALRKLYSKMCLVIQSRVLAGLIKVDPKVMPLYQRTFYVKPSGDTDVIEKQQRIQMMQQAWSVIQNTPANVAFLSDMLELMFPDTASKYIQLFMQAQQQQQSQQAQQQQQMMQGMAQMAQGVIKLSQEPSMFSETGMIHAYPLIKSSAQQIQQMQEAQSKQPQAPAQQ